MKTVSAHFYNIITRHGIYFLRNWLKIESPRRWITCCTGFDSYICNRYDYFAELEDSASERERGPGVGLTEGNTSVRICLTQRRNFFTFKLYRINEKNYYRCNSNSSIWLEQHETRYNLQHIGLFDDIRLFSFAYRIYVHVIVCDLKYIAFRLISFTGIISDYCYLISTSFLQMRTYVQSYRCISKKNLKDRNIYLTKILE